MLPPVYTSLVAILAFGASAFSLYIFGRFSNASSIREAKRHIRRYLFELRLYSDDPREVWRCQGKLLAWNARYFRRVLPPAAVAIIPTALLLLLVEPLFQYRPLHRGETALVSAKFRDAADQSAATLLPARGIVLETPPVRIPEDRTSWWRVRFVGGAASVEIRSPHASRLQRIDTEEDAWQTRVEHRLASGLTRSISVEYPNASLNVFGWRIHWVAWFAAVSFASAIFLFQRLRVVF